MSDCRAVRDTASTSERPATRQDRNWNSRNCRKWPGAAGRTESRERQVVRAGAHPGTMLRTRPRAPHGSRSRLQGYLVVARPLCGNAEGVLAIIDHNRRMQVLDAGWSAIFILHEFFPFGRINAIGVGSSRPDIDAAGAPAVLTHPIVLAQQTGHLLIFRSRGLKRPGHLRQRAWFCQLKRNNSNDHLALRSQT